ncbi:MAG: hypothetical protein ACRD0H_24095, partial [Actinomycetes bacterium]
PTGRTEAPPPAPTTPPSPRPAPPGEPRTGGEPPQRRLYAVSAHGDLTHRRGGPAPAAGPDPATPRGRWVSLRDALDEGIVTGVSLATLRKAPQRCTDFPAGLGRPGQDTLYDADQLARWARNRPRSIS